MLLENENVTIDIKIHIYLKKLFNESTNQRNTPDTSHNTIWNISMKNNSLTTIDEFISSTQNICILLTILYTILMY